MADTASTRFISCDPGIYAEGGFLDEPAILERIRAEHEIAPPAIETEAVLYRPTGYERVFRRDRVFGNETLVEELEEFYDQTNALYPRTPACVLAKITDGRILDRAIYQERDGVVRPLYETHRFGDRPYLEWTDKGGTAEELPDGQDYLLLSSIGTFNWGHWLIDDLARIKGILTRAAAPGRRLCVLLHGYYPEIDNVRLESLKALLDPSIRTRFHLLAPNRTYLARTLYFVSPVSVHPGLKHPEALADVANLARAAAAARGPGLFRRRRERPKKLFVIRRPGRGRVPTNLDEVQAAFVARGYAPLDPEGMSATEQIEAFSAADTVAGCMGAAMANTVFCAGGAKLLYIAPDTFRDPFYWDQAASRGQDYAVLYGRSVDPERPTDSDHVIAPALLKRALDSLD